MEHYPSTSRDPRLRNRRHPQELSEPRPGPSDTHHSYQFSDPKYNYHQFSAQLGHPHYPNYDPYANIILHNQAVARPNSIGQNGLPLNASSIQHDPAVVMASRGQYGLPVGASSFSHDPAPAVTVSRGQYGPPVAASSIPHDLRVATNRGQHDPSSIPHDPAVTAIRGQHGPPVQGYGALAVSRPQFNIANPVAMLDPKFHYQRPAAGSVQHAPQPRPYRPLPMPRFNHRWKKNKLKQELIDNTNTVDDLIRTLAKVDFPSSWETEKIIVPSKYKEVSEKKPTKSAAISYPSWTKPVDLIELSDDEKPPKFIDLSDEPQKTVEIKEVTRPGGIEPEKSAEKKDQKPKIKDETEITLGESFYQADNYKIRLPAGPHTQPDDLAPTLSKIIKTEYTPRYRYFGEIGETVAKIPEKRQRLEEESGCGAAKRSGSEANYTEGECSLTTDEITTSEYYFSSDIPVETDIKPDMP